MTDEESEKLSDKEKKISRAAVWIWRNLFASGVFVILFWIGYNWIGNEFDGVKTKLSDVEHEVIEVRTVVQERIRIDRGDYGWPEPASHAPNVTDEEYDEWLKEGNTIRQHIDDFADGVFKK